jgi:peptidoglycan/LPS O-acetylase OafA/YrhL
MVQYSEKNRIYFLDNLRTFIIFLVVCYHAGWVYESSGVLSWAWIVDDPSKNNFVGLFNLILDIFMMPVMFFISGYFAPLSLKRKTGKSFLISRLKRLMVPWILAVLVLLPLYKVIYLFSRDLPQEGLWSYFHFNGGILINQGWLWFLPVLFLFDMVYLAMSKINLPVRNMGMKAAVPAVFLIGFAYSFAMSWYGFYGWTKTILLDFQNERILIYFMAFLVGALCYKLDIFNGKPAGKKLYYILCATIWIPMNMYIIFLLNLIFKPGQYIISGATDIAMTWFGFHLSLLGMMYIVINTFRYYLNRGGKFVNWLNKCSFGVYVVHFIAMGAAGTVLLHSAMPSLVKYGLLTLITFAASNVMVYIYHLSVQGVWQLKVDRA